MRYWTAKYFPPSCKVVIQSFVELLLELVYILSKNKHSFVFRWHFSPFSLRNIPSPSCIVIEKPEIEEEHPARIIIGSHDNSNEKRFTRNILHLIESQGPSPRVQSKKRAIFSGKKFQWVFHIPIMMWNCENLFKPNKRARRPVSVVETLSS